ncbi:hypothetical protein HPB47_013864 [Ixodes persulcatus]|uniref:Uncharacterized protein n=1 Tax=Ixodes persulcatus TaxID=34615 RepID=A0AC60R069_IXOPE|nr:hypothetical protein HPB47_013864 [Ixodes persulcatus]
MSLQVKLIHLPNQWIQLVHCQQSRCQPEAAERAAKPKKRQASQSSLLAQLLEEQRQLRYSHKKSRKRELDIREQQLKLQERAAEREDRLIDVLAQLVNK